MPESMIDAGKLENLDLGGFGINETESTMGEAMKLDPTVQAERQQLSQDSGVPEFAIEGNESRIKQDINMSKIDFKKLAEQNPGTNRYLSNLDNAAISHDDTDSLSGLETALLAAKNVGSVPHLLAESAAGAFEGPLRLISEYLTQPAAQAAKEYLGFRDVRDPAAMAADYFASQAGVARNIVGELTARNKELSPAMQATMSGLQSGVQSVATMVAAMYSGNPALMLPMMGGITYGKSVSEALSKGVPVAQANLFAVSQGVIEVATEKLMLKPLVKLLKNDGGFVKNTIGFLAREVPGEQVATILQDLNDWAIMPENREKTFANYIDERPDAAISTAIATVVGGGVQIGAVKAMSYGYERSYRKAEAAAFNVKDRVNQNDQQTIDAINQFATASTTRERNSEKFKQFVQGIDSESEIHIETDAVKTFMQTKTDDEITTDPALTLMQEKLNAEDAGSTIAIPVADFATDIAGSDHYGELRQHMTLDPETPTPAREADAVAEQQRYVDTLMSEAEENASQYVEAQEIFATVRDQLIDTGRMDSQQASAVANIVPAYIAVKAKELKLTVAEVYEQFGLTIEGPMTGKAEELADTLKQVVFQPDTKAVTQSVKDTGGVTLNPDGSEFTAETGYVATLRSINIPEGAGINEAMAEFAAENAPLLSRENVVIGAFDFGDGQRSIDINIVTEDRAEVMKIGTELDQDSIWDIAANDIIKTGGTGGVGMTLAQAEDFLTKRDAPKQTADDFAEFFTAVTEGEEGKPSLKKAYEPVITTPVDAGFKKSIDKHRGNFDLHIASSIPGHREVQDLVGTAIAETFKTGSILDIGASEGAMVKAIVENSNMTGVALDPNDAMGATFNKKKVKGASYVNEAFGTDVAEDGTEAWPGTNWYNPGKKQFDVIHESMVFQFIHNDRAAQISRVADLLKDDGVAIFEEKVFTDQWDANEKKKNEYKGQYFNKADLTQKSDEVLEGMNENMVSQDELERVLYKNFKYVTQYWDAGNFKGYAASNDRETLGKLVRNIGDTTTEYSAKAVLKQPTQTTDDVFRGTYSTENIVIRLHEASDLSTFLHEFAHFMLDMEQKTDGAQLPAIGNWIIGNIDAVTDEARLNAMSTTILTNHVRDYVENGTAGDKERDNAIAEAIHEQFARGFEAYLMEGKAPSMEMRNVFRTFSRWLVQIYKSITGLNVALTDDIRQVFGRLLATEEQIEMAEARAKFEPLFTDAATAGMTEEQFAKYQAGITKADDVAKETLRDQMIKQIHRQTLKWWKTEMKDLIDEEKVSLAEEPVYKAREILKTKFKMDHAAVKAAYSIEKTNKLGRTSVVIPPALIGMTVKGGEGIAINDAAAFLGYNSGDEMIQDIMTAPKLNDVAEQNAERRMIEKHGDILTDGTIEQLADEAIQNEERGKQILTELKALYKGTNQAVLDRRTLKFMAEEAIGGMSFRKINPGRYRAAEIRAAQESATALAEGNKPAAAEAKSRQAMNHYMAIAATEAKNDIMKIVDRTARYRKKAIREAIMKAGNGYMEQIDKILRRFEFRKAATLKQVDKVNQAIGEWARERMEVDGDGLMLNPAVLDETFITHWKNVQYSDLRGIADSLKNMEHVARYSNKIKLAEDERDYQQVVTGWVNNMNEHPTKFKSQRTDVARGRNYGRWAMAQMTKIPWMASWLDGGERAGMSHDILMHPLNVAYNEEVKLWKDIGSVVMDVIKNRDRATLKRHNAKVFIPEIQDENNDGNLMGHQILAVALNTGNAGNLKKMLLGEGWANEEEISFNNPQLQAVLAHMTGEDWAMVQQIWDQMDLLYPMLAEVHQRTTGLTPPKVEATPLTIEGVGTFKGGYYPLKYDPQRSHKAEQDEARAAAALESMFGGALSIQASVNASATSERTGYYAPIRLSLDVIQNHFQETIHYITHHDAVRQINKLIRNESVATTIREKLGDEEFAQLRPWLNDVAKDGREAPVKMFWDAAMQKLRFGTTLGIMGFKASTGLMQILGLANTAGEVGTANLIHALRTIIGSPETMQSAWEFAVDNSTVMNHRAQSMDREIRSAMTKLAGKKGLIAGIQATSMKHIALIQTYMVDLPTWHAAYIKGMKDWGDEERSFKYADWAVENIQGSGLQKDMARIMRGQAETGRMFTMFMTFFSSLWNMERDLVKGARSGRYSVTTVAAKAMFFFVVPVMVEMWMRGEFDIDDDDDEDLRLQKMLLNVSLYPVQSIPFARDVANGLMSGYGYNMSPIAQILEGGIKAAPMIVERMFTEEEITKGMVKATTKVTGAALGVPGINQAWATSEHLYEVLEEGEDLTLRQLIYGPKR